MAVVLYRMPATSSTPVSVRLSSVLTKDVVQAVHTNITTRAGHGLSERHFVFSDQRVEIRWRFGSLWVVGLSGCCWW